MTFDFEERIPESPFVKRFWRAHSERAGTFTSAASVQSGIVVMKHEGRLSITFRGPETRATEADFPAEAEWFGVDLALGAFLPHLPPKTLRDRQDLTLPGASGRGFWLYGAVWEYPDFDDADVFLTRLVREGLLVQDPVVEAVRQGRATSLSRRTLEMRFMRATGLSPGMVRQIERARQAAALLEKDISILDATHEAGYFDQPHLTRSLRRFLGQTPREIALLASS